MKRDFYFNSSMTDFNRVLNGGPWSFKNNMIALSSIKESEIPKEMPLNFILIWVQIHNLLAGFMSAMVDQHIGNFIGAFMKYDNKNNSNVQKSYMSIRVLLDVKQPLKISKKVKKKTSRRMEGGLV